MRHELPDGVILEGHVLDALASLPAESVQMCVTSPPYFGLRKYSGEQTTQWSDGQWAYGLEDSPSRWAEHTLEWLRAVRRALRRDGVVWLNVGASYAGGSIASHQRNHAGYKALDLIDPFALLYPGLLADGWYVRSVVTICKGNPMPESVRNRPTRATEYMIMLTKSRRYYYDPDAVRIGPDFRNEPNGVLEKGFEGGFGQGALTLSTHSGNVTGDSELTPYLIFAALLAAKRVLIEERHELFRDVLRVLQHPSYLGIGLLPRLHREQQASQVFIDIFKHLGIVISESDFERQAVLRPPNGPTTLPLPIVNYEASLSIYEASKVVAEIIANAKAIRDTFSLDSVLESSEVIDAINKSIPFPECLGFLSKFGGDGLISPSKVEKFLLALSDNRINGSSLSVRHEPIITQPIRANHNLWNYWIINSAPYSDAHFATFAPIIPKICILSSTPDAGVCAVCGAPWARVIGEVTYTKNRPSAGDDPRSRADDNFAHANGSSGWQGNNLLRNPPETLGWRPTCSHAEAMPSTVLDVFGGSMTSAVVARQLGRRFICIELSPEYVQMGLKRLTQTQPAMGLV